MNTKKFMICKYVTNYKRWTKFNGINPISLSNPCTDSYFKNCIWPSKIDTNLPRYAVLCDKDKSTTKM